MRLKESNHFETDSNIERNILKCNKSTFKTDEKLDNVDHKIINTDRCRADKLIPRTTVFFNLSSKNY